MLDALGYKSVDDLRRAQLSHMLPPREEPWVSIWNAEVLINEAIKHSNSKK